MAALGSFCVYKQCPFPGKHCNMSNRWRALFPKDDRSNPIVWAILKETGHIATSSRHQSHVRRRMEWSAQPVQAWHPHSPCDSNLCFLASPWKAPAWSSLWDSMLRHPASSLSLHSDRLPLLLMLSRAFVNFCHLFHKAAGGAFSLFPLLFNSTSPFGAIPWACSRCVQDLADNLSCWAPELKAPFFISDQLTQHPRQTTSTISITWRSKRGRRISQSLSVSPQHT